MDEKSMRIKDEKIQYGINREAENISASHLEKPIYIYEYFTG